MSQKFKSDIETQAGLIDSFGFTGTAGQVLSSTGTKTEWITPPQSPGGGGSSQVFYFNGGTASSVGGYYQMSPVANTGTAADFTINADGYIASFLTDVASPNQLNIPAGNWNFEIYFSASSSGGSPSFYVELYKYSSGGVFTLIASSSAAPEGITNGTTIDAYFTPLAVPATTLLVTDRLAVRVYVTHSGRTITMHTQNGHLSEVITTFSTGLTALNGLTAQVQYFTVGTAGTDFNISSATNTHTFNLPTASATNRGALSSADWSTFNGKFTLPSLTSGSVLFSNGTTIAQDNANFFWDDTNNRLGIGTTTPGEKLDVVGTGYIRTALLTNAVRPYSGNQLTLLGGGINTLYINGNVGIGTSSPTEKLSVSGIIRAFGAGNAGRITSVDTQVGGATIAFNPQFSTGVPGIETIGAFPIAFYTNFSEKMRITSSGNVGIGTTVPDTLLHVSSLNSSILRLESTNTALVLDAVVGEIQFEANDASASGVGVKGKIGAYSDVAAGNAVGLRFFTAAAGVATATEKMRISATGNVGIGTTTPTSKLHSVADLSGAGSYDSRCAIFGYNSSTDELYNNPIGVAGRVSIEGGIAIYGDTSNTGGWAGYFDGKGYFSGNVGIGTTSPGVKFVNSGAVSSLGPTLGSGAVGSQALLSNNGLYGMYSGVSTNGDVWHQVQRNDANVAVYNLALQPSGGSILIGTTAPVYTPTSKVQVLFNGLSEYGMTFKTTFSVGIALNFINSAGVQVGQVFTDSTSTAYTTTSDYRLKEDLKEIKGLDLISQINVYDYKWKSNDKRSFGVLAHELQEVIPQAVFGEKDKEENMQSVDYSILVPILVQAIKELKAEIELLKQKYDKI